MNILLNLVVKFPFNPIAHRGEQNLLSADKNGNIFSLDKTIKYTFPDLGKKGKYSEKFPQILRGTRN